VPLKPQTENAYQTPESAPCGHLDSPAILGAGAVSLPDKVNQQTNGKHKAMNDLSWHQTQAIRRQFKTRNLPAHIEGGDYIRTGKALCGTENPRVRIDAAHRHNPENKCCKRCLVIANMKKL
jgi:hypothetical protein